MLENKETRKAVCKEITEKYEIKHDSVECMFTTVDGCSLFINLDGIKDQIEREYKMRVYSEIEREVRLCALDELVQICKRKKSVWHGFRNDKGSDSEMVKIYHSEYIALRSTARELAGEWGLEDATLHEILMQL